MKMTPAPRFLHILSMRMAENKIGGVHVVDEQGCAMGMVVGNGSERLAHIERGHIVFFRGENANLIKLDAEGENCVLFEDAVMGSCRPEELSGALASEQNFVKAPETPIVRANGNHGVIVRPPRIR